MQGHVDPLVPGEDLPPDHIHFKAQAEYVLGGERGVTRRGSLCHGLEFREVGVGEERLRQRIRPVDEHELGDGIGMLGRIVHDQVRAQGVAHEHGRRGQVEFGHHGDEVTQEGVEGVALGRGREAVTPEIEGHDVMIPPQQRDQLVQVGLCAVQSRTQHQRASQAAP